MNTSWSQAHACFLLAIPDYIGCIKAGYQCRIVRIENSEALFPAEDPSVRWVYAIEILGRREGVPMLIKLQSRFMTLLSIWKPKYRYRLDMGSYVCHMLSWGAVSMDIRIPKRREEGDNDASSLRASRVQQ
jgi:hypothetical protein